MYLLIEWEGRMGKYLARGHDHAVRNERSKVCANDQEPNISRPALPSVNKHFIIWPSFLLPCKPNKYSARKQCKHRVGPAARMGHMIITYIWKCKYVKTYYSLVWKILIPIIICVPSKNARFHWLLSVHYFFIRKNKNINNSFSGIWRDQKCIIS